MPVTHYKVEGFDNLKNLILELDSKCEPIYMIFSGSKDKDGKSWCPDCVKAEPVVHDFLSKTEFKKHFNFIHVGIDRTLWRDTENPYRTDPKFRIKVVPTLMRWGGTQKIEEDECADTSFLELIFEDCM